MNTIIVNYKDNIFNINEFSHLHESIGQRDVELHIVLKSGKTLPLVDMFTTNPKKHEENKKILKQEKEVFKEFLKKSDNSHIDFYYLRFY